MNKEQLQRLLWNAADTLRGTLDSSTYKDYLLTMLFVKYLSDIYKRDIDNIKSKIKDQREQQYLRKKLPFKLSEESTFDWLYENRRDDNLGGLIDDTLSKIEQDNEAILKDVFRNIKFNSEINLGEVNERNNILRTLLEAFNDEELNFQKINQSEINDILGDAYEYLIGQFASDAGKKGGEFYTPKEVSKLLSELVDVQPNETVYDPTCGSGSLLLSVVKKKKEIKNITIYGQEKNSQTFSLARMNMLLHGENATELKRGDTLRDPKFKNENNVNEVKKFDIVVANPPFSLSNWGADELQNDQFGRFNRGLPPKDRGDYAFVQHMIASLKEKTGRMACILPEGPLFRVGSEGKIRKALIEEKLINTIIKLPPNLFYGTGIGTAIMFVRGKNSKYKSDDVLFIDASKDFEAVKNQNKLRNKDIAKIVSAFKTRKTINQYSYLATIKEIEENDFSLSINQYVDNQEKELEYDLQQLQKEIQNLTKKVKKGDEELEKLLKGVEIWK